MSDKLVFFWKDKDCRDMSRDELLEVIAYQAEELARFRAPAAIRAYALGKGEMMKRGERAV